MPKEPERYHIFTGGKTARSKPKLLAKVQGQKEALNQAKKWQEEHPGRYVGVFQMKRVKVFKPTNHKRRGKRR